MLKSIVSLENFPYKEDISVYIDRFINNKKIKSNYTTETSLKNPNLTEIKFFKNVLILFNKY